MFKVIGSVKDFDDFSGPTVLLPAQLQLCELNACRPTAWILRYTPIREFDANMPKAAQMRNYWLGGKGNFAAKRPVRNSS